MIHVTSHGDFKKTTRYLEKLSSKQLFSSLERHGRIGVDALSRSTPREKGETANSWDFEIERSTNRVAIHWVNDHVDDGVNVAVILQYGHGTGTGGYVQGRDYINPSMRPIFDKIVADVWKEVTSG